MLKFSAAALFAGMTAGLLYFDSIPMGLILFFLSYAAYPAYREAMENKRKQQMLIQFRDLLYSLSASMSLGRSMKQALEESRSFWGNTYTEKDLIMKEVSAMLREMETTKARDIDVLRDFAERSGLPDIVDFVNVYDSCRTTGGNMPKAISRAAVIIGEKISMERELNTALSEKLAEGRIVGTAPFLMTLALRVLSPGYMRPLYDTSAGHAAAAVSLGLTVVSVIMTERINRIVF